MSPLLAALLLGIVEGLTEFLPVSSTGHLILMSSWLGQEGSAADTFDVVIQLGAVLAVIVYYRSLLARMVHGLLKRDPATIRLTIGLGIAFLPAAILGLLIHGSTGKLGFSRVPVATALIVGGIAMIVLELFARRPTARVAQVGLDKIGPLRALWIGIAQCASLWPGMSRSMSTIIGGKLTGLDTATAAEFSFLLSIPVLGAATAYELLKHGGELAKAPGGVAALATGLVTAFVVSLAVIAVFLKFLKKIGLVPFGVYRILLGIVVLVFAAG